MVALFANSGDSDQMLHSFASDLCFHCLPFIPLGVSRHSICFHGEIRKYFMLNKLRCHAHF